MEKMSFSEFKSTLNHHRTKIFIPCLNRNIDKTYLFTNGVYDAEKEREMIEYAYKLYTGEA